MDIEYLNRARGAKEPSNAVRNTQERNEMKEIMCELACKYIWNDEIDKLKRLFSFTKREDIYGEILVKLKTI